MENTQEIGESPEPLSIEKKRLCDVLTLMENVYKQRDPTTTVEAHKSFMAWEGDLRGLPGIFFNREADGETIWMEVQRLTPTSSPLCSPCLEPWLKRSDDPAVEPGLHPHIKVQVRWEESKEYAARVAAGEDVSLIATGFELHSLVGELVSLDVHPEVQEEFEQYKTSKWLPWAEAERLRRATMKIYSSLFELMRRMELENSATGAELVWGVGIAVGTLQDQKIRYPLITSQVFLTIDESSNAILARPRRDSIVLESLIYEKLAIPGVNNLVARFKEWSEKDRAPLSPFVPDTFFDVVKTATAQLAENGIYWPDVNTNAEDRGLPTREDAFLVTDSWVLFSRKKSSHFFVDDARRLKENVQQVDEVFGGPRALVSDPSDKQQQEVRRNYRGIWGVIQSSFGAQETTPSAPQELYFPKPYNSEQLDIIDRLSVADGVVVQGPPGTGKTHTIANVICHYLAHGKRILVTSNGEAALRVLRDKLPAGIKELVVTRLQNDQEGTRQLKRSIDHIANEVASASPEQLRRQIRDLEERIDLLHQKLDGYNAKMREWAHSQTNVVPSDPEGRSPIEIAQLVYSQRAVYEWFPDDIGVGGSFLPRFSREDIASLREARLSLGEDLRYLNETLPSSNDLPAAHVVVRLHEDLCTLAGLSRESHSTSALALATLDPSTVEAAERLLAEVSCRLELLPVLRGGTESTKKVLAEIQDRYEGPIAQELLKIRAEVSEIEQQRVSRISSRVEIPEGAEGSDILRECIDKCAAGEKVSGLFKRAFSPSLRAALDKLKEIRINTEPVKDTSGWARIVKELATFDRIRELSIRWNNMAAEVGLPNVAGVRYEVLRALLKESALVDDAHKFSPPEAARLREIARRVFSEPSEIGEPFLGEPSLRKLQSSLQLGLPHQRRGSFEQRRKDILAKFEGFSGEPVTQALRLLTETLGSLEVDNATIITEWTRIGEVLSKRESQRHWFKEVRRVANLFEESGAPIFAEKLKIQPTLGAHDPLLPENLPEAWQLRRFATYLSEIDCHARLQKLMSDREQAEKRLASSYEELVKCRTWLELKGRLTARVSSSLEAYVSAIKSLGKGTGVSAERHRTAARNAMNEAWEAIPCWIMSTARVSESVPARMGLFDLVIIDEASQSYLDALPALVRGKKILVVGDDEQISPTAFTSENDINMYRERYLRDLPKNFQSQLAPGKSIYDFARVVFPEGKVTLREHFRCASAIIEFSNLLCYDGRIQCLRVPKPSERLDPPLVDVYVKSGWRQDKVNRAEAKAIVREIETISKTPGMEDRSIGVISLVGSEQAKIINDDLMATLGEEIIRRHDIVCGDAYTLQGNERDIVFLSMITTPEEVRSQTGRETKQRFNVAASRARDRMYLYRSVRREDLKEGDLKARLLDHFQAPMPGEEPEVVELREKCDSSFELAIFDELVKRGYQVTPQVSSSGYRIDIVVEGDNDARLAIECDGDQYHGPSQWEEDYKRQRILERAGWKFWRCWGSSFYRNPDGCLDDLFAKLDSLGIKPIPGGAQAEVSRFVEYREVDPFEVPEHSEAQSDEEIPVDVQSQTLEPVTPLAISDEAPEAPQRRERGRVDLDELVEYVFEDLPDEIHSLRVVELGVTSLSLGIVAANGSLGSVLLGSRVADTFEVHLGGKTRLARIVAIHDIDEAEGQLPPTQIEEQLNLSLQPPNIPAGVTLHPYTNWKSHPVPDPREAKPSAILAGLEEIVAAEGPISCDRAFFLYAKAAGYQRLGAEIRDALFRGLQAGINKQRILSANELRRKDRLRCILSIPGQSAKLPRESGGREFNQIPPSELKILLEQVIAASGGGGDRSSIHREVVRLMGGNRLAAAAREHLARVEEMMAQVELL